jgi:hypothetical protein
MMRWLVRLMALLIFLASSAVLYDRWRMRDPLADISPIDPMPHTRELIAAERFAEAEVYLAYFVEHNSSVVTPQARELLQAIHAKRQSWEYRAKSLLGGAITGESNEVEGMVGAGIADLFVVGDIRDVVIEGRHWLAGEKVDDVVLALSSLGIAATAATIGTAGGAGGVKGSISLLKQMRKGKLLPAWFIKALSRLPKAADIKRESNTLLEPITILYREGGWLATRDILRSSKNLQDLKRKQFFAKTFKRESAVLLKIDPQAVRLAEHFPARTITRASLFGKAGFRQLARQLKYLSRMSKIISKQWQGWLRAVPLWLVIGVWGVSLFFILPRIRRAKGA